MAMGSEGRVPSAPGRFLVLSLRLRDRRRSLGLTQLQVVRRLEAFGVTTTNKALSSLEHGAGIDAAKLPEFAAALDCTVTYLLGLTDDPSAWQPDNPLGPPAHRGAEPSAASASPRLTQAPKLDPVDGHAPATNWILGPYPSDSVPGDRVGNPPPD